MDVVKRDAGILSLVAAGIVALFFWRYAFNWPLAEDYRYIDLYRYAVVHHQLSFAAAPVWHYVDWYGFFSPEHPSGPINPIDILFIHNEAHRLGIQAALGLALMSIFGVTFIPFFVLEFLLLLSAALLLSLMVTRDLRSAWSRLLIWPALILLLFHPTQTNHLLWPFELGWMVITFLVALNACLIERFRSPLVALPGAAIAAFCSAQGSLLLLAAALHIVLLPGLKRRAVWVALLLGVFVGLVVLAPEWAPAITHIGKIARYFIALLGSLFGVREPRLILALGAIELALGAALTASAVRRGLDGSDRIGLNLICYGLLGSATFSLGRGELGLGWVLDRFHAAPVVMPFGVGLAILALRAADRINGWRWIRPVGGFAFALVMVSVLTALPYAITRARESSEERAVKMAMTCHGQATSDMFDELKASRDLPLIEDLCRQSIPAETARMLVLPALYRSMIAQDQSAKEPLERLWLVYLTHFDLQRAMPFDNPKTPAQLLGFACNDARTGSHYDPPGLKEYAGFFQPLVPPD